MYIAWRIRRSTHAAHFAFAMVGEDSLGQQKGRPQSRTQASRREVELSSLRICALSTNAQVMRDTLET